ncbi:ABC transporter substrate-binding protein [Variovorax sp. J22R24]|uniref:ABC transporter substrate-binding protein n=1 Tax=Variovorax gracilis TaxID=3053502 RepID=UPI002578C601|nr:ABC transporter substrate-binding protein [Variovorax sp. J22R24]MDM0109168.1 ABC transporter substrate-binding protein [Variovorax sp. J22R24]
MHRSPIEEVPVSYSPHDVEALAPKGVLRATINLGNPILARQNEGQGPTGVSVDLARALACQLGVPLELIVLDGAGKAVDAVASEQADVGFFAIDPIRGKGIEFTPPYVLIEGCYLVRNASPIRASAEVDRPGVRVGVGKGSAYDLFLTRSLHEAEIVRAPTSPAVVDTFIHANLEVAAGVKQQLEADALRIGGLRLLPERFMVIEQAMGSAKGRGSLASFLLAGFIAHAKASGFVHEALKRNGVEGAAVAP